MVLEATMICVDNSDYMRNGDFPPSRFQQQSDALNLVLGQKFQSNPENSVGVLTMAGKSVKVLLTPTNDLGKLLACLHGQEQNLGGEVNLTTAINVAQLALKHRQNKIQRQRIIVFAGSPVNSDQKDLVKIGNNLRKNSVALDIINFGEEDAEKEAKLTALVEAVNKNNSNATSHIVTVHSGNKYLSDELLSTPIFMDGEDGGVVGGFVAAAGGGGGFEFGVDPNTDPELALALRISMEEERARQAAEGEVEASTSASNSQDVGMNVDEEDENALLQQALAISMEEDAPIVSDSASEEDVSKVLDDQSYMSAILASLPGVDPNDPSVRDLLASMKEQSDDEQNSAPEEEEKK